MPPKKKRTFSQQEPGVQVKHLTANYCALPAPDDFLKGHVLFLYCTKGQREYEETRKVLIEHIKSSSANLPEGKLAEAARIIKNHLRSLVLKTMKQKKNYLRPNNFEEFRKLCEEKFPLLPRQCTCIANQRLEIGSADASAGERQDSEYPFARRSCSCGHKFTAKATPKARRKERQDNNEIGNRLRRAVRTKRSRPDFFNPSENHSVRRRNVESDARKKRRGRPRGAISKPKPDAEKAKEKEVQKPVEEDVYSNVPPGRAAIHSLILGEINRKMAIQNFKPA